MLHLADAERHGLKTVVIRTVDTDVVVLAIESVNRLNLDALWILFGTGKHLRYIAAHDIARELGPDRCVALPMFHAMTGCDSVSFFAGRGKKTAWEVWKTYDTITRAFRILGELPHNVDDQMTDVERFTVLLCDRASNAVEVNQARKELFSQRGRAIENIPPTQAALLQHTRGGWIYLVSGNGKRTSTAISWRLGLETNC